MSKPLSRFFGRVAGWAAGTLGPLLLSGLAHSISWKKIGHAADASFWDEAEAGVGAFWHDQQLMMPWLFLESRIEAKKDLFMLISQHRDGRYIASAMEKIGIRTIAGSSTRGGKEALFKLAAKIKDGQHVGITPDGPKGPRHVVKQGVVRLAQLSRCPIYPAVVYVKSAWQFSSWDKMRLPKPFTKGVRIIGDPIYVPRKLSKSQLEEYAKKLQDTLIELTEEAKSALEANQ